MTKYRILTYSNDEFVPQYKLLNIIWIGCGVGYSSMQEAKAWIEQEKKTALRQKLVDISYID